ncbi:MAG: hypothetical protein NC416_08910 [Eubacterium sp.]|nr:hypothetical protein [Eubacterium sp.]
MTVRENAETNFHMAMVKADQLEEIAQKLSDLSDRRLGGTMQELSCGWKGENAYAYLKKGAKLQGRIKETADDLKSAAEELRNAGRKAYREGKNI